MRDPRQPYTAGAPRNSFDDLLGDPWQTEPRHEVTDAPRADVVNAEWEAAESRLYALKGALFQKAEQALGPQSGWTDETYRAVSEDVERQVQEQLDEYVSEGPANHMQHGHEIPLTQQQRLLYSGQSARDEHVIKDRVATALWQHFLSVYGEVDVRAAERAASAVGDTYAQRGSNLLQEIQRRGADAVCSDIYGALRYEAPTYDQDDGRTALPGGGGYSGSGTSSPGPGAGDMISELQALQRRGGYF